MTPKTDSLKKGEFTWSNVVTKAFVKIKQQMVKGSIMHLPNFFKLFKVVCDA